MATRIRDEITWVAIDPGNSRLSPLHIEGVLKDSAAELGVTLDWLATNPITTGEVRFGFLFASAQETSPLKELVLERIEAAHSCEEEGLIQAISGGKSGRYLLFPKDFGEIQGLEASELISTSAIEQVIAIGEKLPKHAIIERANYLRPVLYEGSITLFVERLSNGVYAPIEKESPHECCGGAHAPH